MRGLWGYKSKGLGLYEGGWGYSSVICCFTCQLCFPVEVDTLLSNMYGV